MSLKSPSEVRDVSAALQSITKEQFRQLYFSIPPASYGAPYLNAHLPFWELAVSDQRYVLFTADQ